MFKEFRQVIIIFTLTAVSFILNIIFFGDDKGIYALRSGPFGPLVFWGSFVFLILAFASSRLARPKWGVFGAVLSFTLLPIGILLIDTDPSWIFDLSCLNPAPRDYYLFVADNISKGVLVDLLTSYNINLYSCAPKRGDIYVSTIQFAIRASCTYIVIWSLFRMVEEYRAKHATGFN